MIMMLLALCVSFLDKIFHILLYIHDQLIYKPLQKLLVPFVSHLPRQINIFGNNITLVTANRVTLGRTILVILIAICLKCHMNVSACVLVGLHDFLDHLDGIVAKAHRAIYGANIDCPHLGAFLDAFCDKVVNVTLLWTILILTDYSNFHLYQFIVFISVPTLVICSEIVLGIIRVQDYFKIKLLHSTNTNGLVASLEGKLKEKLESIGLAMLCLSLSTDNPMMSISGVIGIISLFLSLRFAYGSLIYKLKARNIKEMNQSNHEYFQSTKVDIGDDVVDKIYTIGCFDLFHRGHINLLLNMQRMGKEVIVGVHSDDSYEKLKHKKPIDNIEKRIKNVKQYANQVYVVAGTDPTVFILCSFDVKDGQTAMYVRGDDMPNFPARETIERLMPIKLLPYTQGISSTNLRAQLLNGTEQR